MIISVDGGELDASSTSSELSRILPKGCTDKNRGGEERQRNMSKPFDATAMSVEQSCYRCQ